MVYLSNCTVCNCHRATCVNLDVEVPRKRGRAVLAWGSKAPPPHTPASPSTQPSARLRGLLRGRCGDARLRAIRDASHGVTTVVMSFRQSSARATMSLLARWPPFSHVWLSSLVATAASWTHHAAVAAQTCPAGSLIHAWFESRSFTQQTWRAWRKTVSKNGCPKRDARPMRGRRLAFPAFRAVTNCWLWALLFGRLGAHPADIECRVTQHQDRNRA